MKKIFAMVMTLCMLVSGISVIPAYAMEVEPNTVATTAIESEVAVAAISDPVEVGYAEVKPYIRDEFFFRNHTDYPQENDENVINLPRVQTADDARVHRLIFKVWFAKDFNDTGLGDVQLTIYVTTSDNRTLTSNSVRTNKVAAGNNEQTEGQFFIEGVSMDEIVDIKFDASTPAGVTSNGNFRSIYVYKADVYCD